MSLLEDLKHRADAIRRAQHIDESRRAANAAVTERAATRTFRYFFDLLKQLEVIRPVNPTPFVVPHVGTFERLALAETFIDYRKHRIDEADFHEKVYFTLTWTAEPDLEVTRDMPPEIAKARDSLWEHNLRFREVESRDSRGADSVAVRRAVFTVPQRIVTDVTIRPNHDAGTLDLYTRNLVRLGVDDFRVPAEEADEAVFEELGRALLGERSTFGRYRTVLERAPARRARPVLVAGTSTR